MRWRFIGGVFLICTTCLAQRQVDFAGRDFFQLRVQLRSYYDSLRSIGDTHAFIEGGDYTEFKKWEEFWELRLKPGDTFEDYYRAYAACKANISSHRAPGNLDYWQEIGPTDRPQLGVMSIGQGAQPGIGPIRFITINDGNPDKMLCGSYSGGVYYTEDAGLNWRNGGSDSWKRSGCHHAVFSGQDPNTWYAANDGFFGWSGGILRTTDAGASWEMIADQADFPQGGIWSQVFKLVVDPNAPDKLFAATVHRLWRTDNCTAATPIWSPVTIPLPTSITTHPVYGSYTFSDTRQTYDLEMDPSNDQKLMATVRFDGELDAENKVHFWLLMRSLDGGTTWTEMPNQPVHAFWDTPHTETIGGNQVTVHEYWNASKITIETTKNASDWLYTYYDLSGSTDELWRMTNATTGIWDSAPLRNDLNTIYGGGNGFGISQTNPANLYVEYDVNSYTIGRYLTYVNGTWSNYYNLTTNELQYHVDAEDFVGHPTNDGEVWLADHGGVHRSTDNGANWEWRGKGLGVAEVYRMGASYSEPDYVAMGLYHDATVLTNGSYQVPWEPDWRQLGGADGQRPMIDAQQGQWIYWSSQGNGSWQRSSDHGVTPMGMSVYGTGSWDTEGELSLNSPATVFVASYVHDLNHAEEVIRSLDHGATFETVSDFVNIFGPGGKNIWRIYPSWSDPNTVYVHFDSEQRLFRTAIAQGTAAAVRNSWVELVPPRLGAWIADIDFDFDNPNIVYVAYGSSVGDQNIPDGSQMLFRVDYTDPNNPLVTDLTGSSQTWTPLPNTGMASGALTLERGSDGGIYVATDVGVYFTNNKLMASGTGWQLFGPGLPSTECKGLDVNYKVNKVRAGLSGRGLWEHDLWCPNQQDANESGTYGSNDFVEVTQQITSTALVPSAIDVNYRAGEQVHLTPEFHAMVGSKFHAFIHPCDHEGNSFRSPTGTQPIFEDGAESDRSTREPSSSAFPDPNSGKFQLAKDAALSVISLIASDPTGRSIPVQYTDQGDRLTCIMPSGTASGTYTFILRLSSGLLEHFNVLIEP